MRTFISKWGNEIAYTDDERRIAELIGYGFREITENEGEKTDGEAQAGKIKKAPAKKAQAAAKGAKK